MTRRHERDEQGTVTAFVACFTLALLTVAGLVVDGGYTLAARRRAFNEADAAARAGAQGVDVAALRAGGRARLLPTRARTLALEHLARAGLEGTVEVRGDEVTVHVTVTQRPAILSAVGLGPFTVHAQGTATPIQGVRTGGD